MYLVYMLINLVSHNLWITGKVYQPFSIVELFILKVIRFCNSRSRDRTIFHKNIQVVVNQKLVMWRMQPKDGIGSEHHKYYKHTKFRQNQRGDPKFLVN